MILESLIQPLRVVHMLQSTTFQLPSVFEAHKWASDLLPFQVDPHVRLLYYYYIEYQWVKLRECIRKQSLVYTKTLVHPVPCTEPVRTGPALQRTTTVGQRA